MNQIVLEMPPAQIPQLYELYGTLVDQGSEPIPVGSDKSVKRNDK